MRIWQLPEQMCGVWRRRDFRWILLFRMYALGERPRRVPENHQFGKFEDGSILPKKKSAECWRRGVMHVCASANATWAFHRCDGYRGVSWRTVLDIRPLEQDGWVCRHLWRRHCTCILREREVSIAILQLTSRLLARPERIHASRYSRLFTTLPELTYVHPHPRQPPLPDIFHNFHLGQRLVVICMLRFVYVEQLYRVHTNFKIWGIFVMRPS